MREWWVTGIKLLELGASGEEDGGLRFMIGPSRERERERV